MRITFLQIDLVCDVPQERLGGRIAHLKLEDVQYITLHLNNLQIPKHQEVAQVNYQSRINCWQDPDTKSHSKHSRM